MRVKNETDLPTNAPFNTATKRLRCVGEAAKNGDIASKRNDKKDTTIRHRFSISNRKFCWYIWFLCSGVLIFTTLEGNWFVNQKERTEKQSHPLPAMNNASMLEHKNHSSAGKVAKGDPVLKRIVEKQMNNVSMLEISAKNQGSKSIGNSSVLQHKIPVIPEQSEVFFWQGRQKKMCQRLQKERKQNPQKSLILKFSYNCDQVHNKRQYGNDVLGLYGMQLAAMAYNADFIAQCNQELEVPNRNIFWWLQITHSADERNTTIYKPGIPSEEDACCGMGKAALHYTSEQIRHDLQRMALQVVGEERKDIDDVAIHFRCGDILRNFVGDTNYGMTKFQTYRNYISSNVSSIGIVTAPFSKQRKLDKPFEKYCMVLTYTLQDYLRYHFPNAKVHIRNDPEESIPTVYSRLVLAKQSFCVRSTFCLFPAIASLGSSYVLEGGVAYFFEPIAKAYPNVYLIRGDFLTSSEIIKKGMNATLSWLTKDKKTAPVTANTTTT